MRFVLAFVLLLAAQAQAATFTVTNTADSGAGSLRQALIDASTDSSYPRTIQFHATFPQGGTIQLQTALPTWSYDMLVIDGNGRSPVLDGRNAVRILSVAEGAREIKLRGLTLRRGRASNGVGGCLNHASPAATTDLYIFDSRFEGCKALANQSNAYGGAVSWVSQGGHVMIHDSVFSGNGAGVVGNSALKEAFGGAVMASGYRIEILRTRFSGNAVERVGGLVQGLGGAVYASGAASVKLIDVELDGNRVIDANAGEIFSAGGAAAMVCSEDDCTMSVERAGFNDNSVSGNMVGGGALVTQGGRLWLSNTSFSGNRALGGSGGALFALLSGELRGLHLSFGDNAADTGAHVALSGVNVALWSWSLMGQVAPGAGAACAFHGATVTGAIDANLFEEHCGVLSATGSTIGPVGALSLDETVYPMSLVPGVGSPAIDQVVSQFGCLAAQDARGGARPQDGDGDGIARCDVGAIEVMPEQLFSDGFEASP